VITIRNISIKKSLNGISSSIVLGRMTWLRLLSVKRCKFISFTVRCWKETCYCWFFLRGTVVMLQFQTPLLMIWVCMFQKPLITLF